MTGTSALRADRLGRRFGGRWALRDCTWELPEGTIAALVGPNGAGKTTLMRLATGLLAPTAGTLEVLGQRPDRRGAPHGLSYLAQDKPLYRGLRVVEMLRAGAALNSGGTWDAPRVRHLVDEARLAPGTRVRALSGGQRSRLALALALGRRPRLLMLDEPLADLDPLARRQTMGLILAEVAETGMSVLISSHVLAELANVCDHLVLVRDGAVRLAGEVETLLADHHLVTGPAAGAPPGRLVHERLAGRHLTALVRGPARGDGLYSVAEPSLEELVLAYLEAPAQGRGIPA